MLELSGIEAAVTRYGKARSRFAASSARGCDVLQARGGLALVAAAADACQHISIRTDLQRVLARTIGQSDHVER